MEKHSKDALLRPKIGRATANDAAFIARMFLISSDGLAAYVWGRDKPEGTDLLAHGANRYARTDTPFSFQNCHVAMTGRELVGMIHAFRMPQSDQGIEEDPVLEPYSHLELPGSLYVSGLAVMDRWRRRGIGTALLDYAEMQAAGYDQISLICFEENEIAMEMYQRRGYHEVARRALVPHECLRYSDGDAVLLAKRLSDGS